MNAKTSLLTTPRLILKDYTAADKDAMVDLLMNREITKTFMIPDFDSREQAETYFDRLLGFYTTGKHIEYGVYLDGKLIGFFNDCGGDEDEIEVGYVIDPAYKGHGYATEVLTAAISELFRMGYRRVVASFFEENIASCRVMQKSGMHLLDRTEDLDYKGQTKHCIFYGIDNPEM